MLTGGYAQKWDPQQGWQQVTGALAMRSARAQAPKGSRRERRERQWKQWRRSEHRFGG